MKTKAPGESPLGLAIIAAAFLAQGKKVPPVPYGLPEAPRRDVTPPTTLAPREDLPVGPAIAKLVKGRADKTRNISLKPALGFPALADEAPLKLLQNNSGLLTRLLTWIRSRGLGRPSTRRLQVAAVVSLGEKRFVAVIQIDGREFLIGGGATNVAMLAPLKEKESFGDLLQDTMTISEEQIAGVAVDQMRKQA
jgi:Flagellar biosynthesis protein, FliO